MTNDSRLSFYDRNFSTTAATCTLGCIGGFFSGGNPLVTYSAGGGQSFDQSAWGAQNVTTAIMKFHTGFLRHEVVAGLDFFYQNDDRVNFAIVGDAPGPERPHPGLRPGGLRAHAQLRQPPRRRGRQRGLLRAATGSGSPSSSRSWAACASTASSAATPPPTRPDRNRACSRPTRSPTPTPRAPRSAASGSRRRTRPTTSPTPRGSRPRGSTSPTPPASRCRPRTSSPPEESDLYEIGAKIGLFDGRLGVAGALFRVDKSNSFDVDPVTGGLILGPLDAGERRRVQGFEASITGRLTDEWSILAGYTYLDGKVQSGPSIGNKAPFVPENSASLWTTYDLTAHTRGWWGLPGKVTVGGGVTVDDGYFPASDNITRIPGSFSLDALISYETDSYRVALNAYNLTDELNYGSSFSTRAVPLSGRTVLVSVGTRF